MSSLEFEFTRSCLSGVDGDDDGMKSAKEAAIHC